MNDSVMQARDAGNNGVITYMGPGERVTQGAGTVVRLPGKLGALSVKERYVRILAGRWMYRLLPLIREYNYDCELLLKWVAWSLNDSWSLKALYLDVLGENVRLGNDIEEERKRKEQRIDRDCCEGWELPQLIESEFGKQSSMQRILKRDLGALLESFEHLKLPECGYFGELKVKIRQVFGLDQAQSDLLEALALLGQVEELERFSYNWDLTDNDADGRKKLYTMLGVKERVFRAALECLTQCGLLVSCRGLAPSDQIERLYDPGDHFSLADFFGRKQGAVEVLPLAEFDLDEGDVNHIKGLLKRKGGRAVNILLYGLPGTGKTSLAYSLAAELGLKVIEVASALRDDTDDRRASLLACVNRASSMEEAVVLVDEAERLLDTSFEPGTNNKDKAWLNTFLERRGIRIIWISNQISHLDQAVRRRFVYSMYFPELDQKGRLSLWQRILRRNKALSLLSAEQQEELARCYKVQAGVIHQAVLEGKALYKKSEFYAGVRRQLDAFVALECNGVDKKTLKKALKRSEGVKAAADYCEEGVCCELKVSELVERCQRADRYLKDTDEDKIRGGCATMLFYGPPGTGKTALARYIAHKLNRRCVVVKASDLLSKWVGGSEQNIAKTFAQAESDDVLTVIDEADSFLYERDKANHSWEVTQVNEFLTQLEECRGLIICTTNHKEGLDQAASRRFAFKLKFDYASPEQCLMLYEKLLSPLCPKEKLTVAQRRELADIRHLTPGDFHAVQSKLGSIFCPSVKGGHAELIAALRKEVKLKNEQGVKEHKIGF